MEIHYTYLWKLFNPGLSEIGASLEKFCFAIILGMTLLLLARFATAGLSDENELEQRVVPDEKVSLLGFFDLVVEKLVAFHDSIMGKDNRRFMPLAGSVFLFVFLSNLLGLIPGMPAITTTVWVNVGVALVVFFAFNFYGVREHGVVGYLKHFFGGPELVKWPLIIVGVIICGLELLSAILRILTLNLRLYWNITADHIVLGIFTDMTGPVIPVFFYFMGFLVCFMQAFVFTLLTMIYILLATQHHEEEH